MACVSTRVDGLLPVELNEMEKKKRAHLNRPPAVPDVPCERRQFHDKHHLRASDVV
jgi:hypothetical protein